MLRSGHPYIRLNITKKSYCLSVPSLSPPACFLPVVDYPDLVHAVEWVLKCDYPDLVHAVEWVLKCDYPDLVHAVEWVLKSVTVYQFHGWPIQPFLLCSSSSSSGSKKGFYVRHQPPSSLPSDVPNTLFLGKFRRNN